MRFLLAFFLLIPTILPAQQKINGRVVNTADNTPVAKASVFLANATVGSTSNDDGLFTLYNVRPRQYDLIVSILGYETFTTTVLVSATDIDLQTIRLTSKAIQLKEVNITPDDYWMHKYALFKSEFLGPSKLAAKCKILNPEVLSLEYGENKLVLNGSSDDFLEIENHELGYKIKYLLNKFHRDGRKGLVYYEGAPLFEEMKGKPSQIEKWKKRRFEVYSGSSMHFLRSVIANNIEGEGFEVRRLIRQKDSTKKDIFGNAQMLVKTPLSTREYVKLTDTRGIYALAFNNHLYVMYTKKIQRYTYRPNYMDKDAPNYATSIIGFEQQYCFFDSNGEILNPQAAMFEGTWAGQRIAEMLPVDYVPPAK